jgi:diguanylate cyclase (GGDEF)-like protein
VILLDVRMDGIDGFETCRRLKANPRTAAAPVIFMTAQERSVESRAEAFAAGACDYLTKPFSRADVLFRVQNAIHRHQQQMLAHQLETCDPVTGLPDRSFLRARLDEELLGAARYDSDLALIMAEIDNLCGIEEQHGPQGRARVLKQFAVLAQSEATHHDSIACWGRGRFVLLLPRMSAEAASNLAGQMGDVWRRIEFRVGDKTLWPTASFGVVSLGSERAGATTSSLVCAAESALRRAQDGGGNRVSVVSHQYGPSPMWQPLCESADAVEAQPT